MYIVLFLNENFKCVVFFDINLYLYKNVFFFILLLFKNTYKNSMSKIMY